VQARDREHVRQPGAAHRFVVAVRDRVAFTEHQGERDAGGARGQRRVQARHDVQARTLQPGAGPPGVEQLDRARVADPDPGSERMARRPRWMRRRIAEPGRGAELADQPHARAREQRRGAHPHEQPGLDRALILNALATQHARERARCAVGSAPRLEHLELQSRDARRRRDRRNLSGERCARQRGGEQEQRRGCGAPAAFWRRKGDRGEQRCTRERRDAEREPQASG
jgi:hypothetical protein